ncbi:ATP-binding protein [Leeuwenhoekiella sp. LLG6367-2.1]|uniref:PAS domain-containing sensor histidine kinase n=1 Tax=Leeuwenhoekiella sp. LLG6367-2.1 TaxID=3160833 RepID=UPI0038684447
MYSEEKSTDKSDLNLEYFFELSPDLMCVAGFDGYFKKVNPSFINTLGYTEAELFAKPISEFIVQADRAITKSKRENLLKSNLLTHFENRYQHKNGGIIWLSWSSIALQNEQVVYAVAKDVTVKKNIEIERNRLLQTLNETNKDLKHFNYSSSHDLRSPLSNLLALHQLLDDSAIESPEVAEYIALLKLSTQNLNEIISSYMEKWIKKDRLILDLIEIKFDDVLNKTKNAINELIRKDKVTFLTDFNEAPSVIFSLDYLQSIFLNIITNAIKYARSGVSPILRISSKRSGNNVQLIFSDNGIGIDLEKAGENLFKLHQRFNPSADIDGKGIGLYLVYNHVTSLGGTIEVSSQLNVGTTFVITFKERKQI